MADNVTVDNGALTDYDVATDEDGSLKHHQYVKLEYGADGTFTKVASGASALPIQDGGNTITVDGTVNVAEPVTVDGTVGVSGAVDTELPAAAALADNTANPTAPAVGSHEMVFDGTTWDRAPGNSTDGALVNLGANNDVTVTGTVTATATNLDIRDLDVAQDDVRTAGMAAHDAAVADNPVAVGGRASSAVPTAVSTDGDAVWTWHDPRGAVKTAMVDDAGDSAMDGTNNALRVNVVAGGAAGGTSATDEATYTPTSSSGTPIMGAADETSPDAAAEGTLAIVRSTLNRALHVNLRDASGNEVSAGGGTQYDEDTAHTAAEKLSMAGVVRKDTAATLVDADNDRTELIVDANGRLHVNGSGVTQPVSGTVTANAGTGTFTIGDGTDAVSVLTDGADNVANTENQLVTAGMGYVFDGTAWDRAPGTTADGALVNLGANNDVTVTSGTVTANQGTAGTAWEVVGDVAHDAAAPANPVVIGGQMETQADSAPGTRAGTDADAVKLATVDGALYVAGSAPQSSHTHFDSTSTVQTDATIKAAPGAGLSIYVTDIVFSIGAATASSIFFEEGSTKVLGPYYLEAINGRGLSIQFKTPKKITANTALTVTNTGATTYSIDVGWFVGPG